MKKYTLHMIDEQGTEEDRDISAKTLTEAIEQAQNIDDWDGMWQYDGYVIIEWSLALAANPSDVLASGSLRIAVQGEDGSAGEVES